MSRLPQFVLLFCLLLLAAYSIYPSSVPDQKQLRKAVYYWKSSFELSNWDTNNFQSRFLDTHQVERIYIRMLDVDWNVLEGAYPIARNNLSIYTNREYDYVPVVFITNKTMLHLKKEEVPALAANLLRQLLRIEKHSHKVCSEIQVDCDWTAKSKERYFELLTAMKKLKPEYKYSATIRLYQYKYAKKCGVPPVDRGMLMMYNISSATTYSEQSSIFNQTDAAKYLSGSSSYPLNLDIALPAFSWSILFRDQQFQGVINDLGTEELRTLPFLQQQSAALFRVETDTLLYGNYVRKGDIIKTETCREPELRSAATLARQAIRNDSTTYVAIFDLDEKDLQHISYEAIERIYTHLY